MVPPFHLVPLYALRHRRSAWSSGKATVTKA